MPGIRSATNTDPAGPSAEDAFRGYLEGLSREDLIELVLALVIIAPEAASFLREEIAGVGHLEAVDPDQLLREVERSLPSLEYVPYEESYSVAAAVDETMDDLERLLDAGAADAVAPALKLMTEELRELIEYADDSDGLIGTACDRAIELYARACCEGTPDGIALAAWLVEFRRRSPGWPAVELGMFVDALDDQALAAYRAGIADWARTAKQGSNDSSYELRNAQVELADHDNDLDAAIALLSEATDVPAYGEIVERLQRVGRSGEALVWLDRAVTAGRVSGRLGFGNAYSIMTSRAVELYDAAGRAEDALSVLRSAFRELVSPEALQTLIAYADGQGRGDEQRHWAFAEAEAQARKPKASGAALVRVWLAEGDLDAAWKAAEAYGPGEAWRQLADASAGPRPAAAAQLYRPQIEARLVRADTRVYPEVASLLLEMRKLARAAGEGDAFAAYLAEIRSRFSRRTALMTTLRQARL